AGAGAESRNPAGKIARILDRLAIHGNNDVALMEASLRGRTVGNDAGDDGALGILHAERRGHLRRDRLDLDAQPTARDVAVGLELCDDVMDGRGRNGEADADAAA